MNRIISSGVRFILKAFLISIGYGVRKVTDYFDDFNLHARVMPVIVVSIPLYACEAWKNKGTAVCKSNMIRIEKVHEHVYGKLSRVLTNDKMIKSIVKNLNQERKQSINPSKKQLERLEKELERLDLKKTKVSRHTRRK